MSEPTNSICFYEVTPGATVRTTEIGGVQYLCLHDIVLAMCDDQLSESKKAWCSMPIEKRVEIIVSGTQVQLPGPGDTVQLSIVFEGAMKLLAWLPCKRSPKDRDKAAKILIGRYAGDREFLRGVYVDTLGGPEVLREWSQWERAKKACELVYILLVVTLQRVINFVNVRTPWRYPFW
jgi:hypothetical protein